MKKLLFIGHSFHNKTRSSDFFLSLLRERFDIHEKNIDPDDVDDIRSLFDIESDEFDAVFVWQLDFLCSLFLSKGMTVFCSPMLDGSYSMPLEHWRPLKDVKFINFSIHMHEHILAAGGQSEYIKYYPELTEDTTVFDGTIRGFFWRRRPDHGIDVDLISRIFGDTLDSLHIHDSPDMEGLPPLSIPDDLPYDVTVSTWFDNRADLEATLASCNFYIAPRVAEGIGMSFLEAMARGMAVTAFDYPTHNEYINNGLNGILFDAGSGSVGKLSGIENYGRAARRTIEFGRTAWEVDSQKIMDWIDTEIESGCPESTLELEDAFRIVSSYTDINKYIEEIRKSFPTHSDDDMVAIAEAKQCMPFSFAENLSHIERVDGWSGPERLHRWVEGTQARVYFDSEDDFDVDQFEFTGLCVGVNDVTLKLNGVDIGKVSLSAAFNCATDVAAPNAVIKKGRNELVLTANEAWPIENGKRIVSMCVKSFLFYISQTSTE